MNEVIAPKKTTVQYTMKKGKVDNIYIRIPVEHGRSILNSLKVDLKKGEKPEVWVVFDSDTKMMCFYYEKAHADQFYAKRIQKDKETNDEMIDKMIEVLRKAKKGSK